MRLIFVINRIETEKDNFTTIRLARRALKEGHTVEFVPLADMSYRQAGGIHAHAVIPRAKDYEDDAALLDDVQDENAREETVCISDADIVMLRSDPADEVSDRPWAPQSALLFAQLAADRSAIVLNDPRNLMDASNKTYFQQYPEVIRPKTVITRDPALIHEFLDREGGKGVIKPLQGSGGQGVFIVDENSGANLNQIIDATIRDGYAIVQEYLPKAADGDLRLLMLNGEPLQVDGAYACFQRYNETDDARSNISAGGKVRMTEPDADALAIAELCAPKLKHDGMYFAGLDIVGDKMMEINVDTPGGINMAEDLTGKDFSGAIIADLERKVRIRNHHRGKLNNKEMNWV